ncbi:GNAT family N-acetyltransferase [Anaerovorax odorimutans]|uniref:GNAT family N-acetyltransferase n=1 Tax=Anaerovorax odorimutans TaxID=109327 RepID=A0ABT1RKN6_9FIRM|nr:GNAT family N-acetyltransferase [Anaerovorax odorimutans]MCQ4635751.1 GNAT family N-acetyltransferase [Anaerovorax odorimutans]
MIKVRKAEMEKIAPLFSGIQDSMVIACLQGYMGDAFVRSWESPEAALIISGEYSFFGGRADSKDGIYLAEHFFDADPGDESVAIFDEDEPEWERILMDQAHNHPVPVTRFGIVQKDYDFDRDLLRQYSQTVPDGFLLKAFDEDIYCQAMKEAWSREFCETFASADDFLSRGFGFAVLDNGLLVSGASTMTVYDGGAELQVATRESHRCRGLAMACAAATVLKCVEMGIRPCWDAANLISRSMALKLGYEYKGEYMTVHMHR